MTSQEIWCCKMNPLLFYLVEARKSALPKEDFI